MKTLIFGGCSCQTEFGREQAILWARLARHLAPDMSIVLFDTAGAFRPDLFIPKELGIKIVRYEDNPGMIGHGGGDGAGRTLCDGIQLADDTGCDYVVYWETDCLMSRPIQEVIDKVSKAGVKCACLPLSQYQFHEWAFAVFNVDWAMETDFIGKYDWHKSFPKVPDGARPSLFRNYLPEFRFADAAGDDLFLLPMSGIRNDKREVNAFNLHNFAPYSPPPWLHMFWDTQTAHRFLELNGIVLQ